MIIVEGSTVALGAPESSFIVFIVSFSFPLAFAIRSALDFVYEAAELTHRASRVPAPGALGCTVLKIDLVFSHVGVRVKITCVRVR